MSTLANSLNSGLAIRIGDEDILLPGLTLDDLGTMERELIKSRPNVLRLAAEASVGLDPESRAELLNAAIAEAKRDAKIGLDEILTWASTTFPGIEFSYWLLLNKARPGKFSREDVNAWLKNLTQEQLLKVVEDRDAASGIDTVGNSSGAVRSKGTAARNRKGKGTATDKGPARVKTKAKNKNRSGRPGAGAIAEKVPNTTRR